jgi:hypothetical protein
VHDWKLVNAKRKEARHEEQLKKREQTRVNSHNQVWTSAVADMKDREEEQSHGTEVDAFTRMQEYPEAGRNG